MLIFTISSNNGTISWKKNQELFFSMMEVLQMKPVLVQVKLTPLSRFVASLFALEIMKKHLVKYGQYYIALGMRIELCLYSCRSDPQTLLK